MKMVSVTSDLDKVIFSSGLILFMVIVTCAAEDTDCSRPPPFVNPHLCCKDPPPSEVAQICSSKTGVPLRFDRAPSMEKQPDISAITCFAECVLNQSKYLNNGKLDMAVIKADLNRKFARDPDYIPVMEAAFQKCSEVAQRQLTAFQNASPPPPPVANGCSPLSGLILGCAYKEFFENCPQSKWNSSPQCNAVQEYIKKCSKS